MKTYGTCEDCDRQSPRRRARGLCPSCYRRLTKRLKKLGLFVPRPVRPVRDRLLEKVQKDENGCWLWTGTLRPDSGYGGFTVSASHRTTAHRASYEEFVGPIPKGMHLDHLCRVHRCINPEHLEVVTPQENVLRSPITMASRWARRTHCEHGHEFTEANTRWKPRSDNPEKKARQCRTCNNARKRSSREVRDAV